MSRYRDLWLNRYGDRSTVDRSAGRQKDAASRVQIYKAAEEVVYYDYEEADRSAGRQKGPASRVQIYGAAEEVVCLTVTKKRIENGRHRV